MELRCVCKDLKLIELLRLARKHGITSADELGALTGAGTKCGMCKPMLDELLQTGKVRIGDQLFAFPDEPEDAA
jgi:bacterioferritin-associated ferredoxin